MKFTRKIGLAIFAILFVAVCSGFADEKTNKKFFDACDNGDEKTVEKMLKKDQELANIEGYFSRKPLMIATCRKYRRIAEILIANGADVNARDSSGWTALMYASRDGNIEIINLLVENGADTNIKDNYGRTAIMIASEYEKKDVEELLFSSLTPEQKAAIEKERQEEEKARKEAEELAKKEAEERERQEREAKKRYRAEDFEYTITDDGKGVRIIRVKNTYGGAVFVIVPAIIEGFPVTEVLLDTGFDKIWLTGFEQPKNIRKIKFLRGVVDCELNLPNCREISFSGCAFKNTTLIIQKEWSGASLDFGGTNIEKVVIQEGVVELKGDGFGFSFYSGRNCTELKSIVFPKSLKAIGLEYFKDCYNLQEVVIPKEINKINFYTGIFADYVFSNCGKLPIATQARLRQLGYEGDF